MVARLGIRALGAAAAASADAAARHEVTITNLTRGQPRTPPVAVARADENEYLEIGADAPLSSHPIAENGDNSVALGAREGSVQGGGTPLVPAGTPGAKMFTDSVTRGVVGDDAGTENNTEALGDIVPPCQGLRGVTGESQGAGKLPVCPPGREDGPDGVGTVAS
jgi:hypothetical protein